MKLNKIEKIIVAVILLGLILVGGTFLFVIPSYKNIEKNTATLAANIQEKNELDEKLARLDTIDADITSSRNDAKKAEGGFYPDLTTYETSEIAMAYLKESGLDAHAISVSSLSTKVLSLDYFTPTEVKYDLKTYSAAAKEVGKDEETLVAGEFYDNNKKYTISVSSVTSATITDEDGNEIAPSKYTEKMKNYYKTAICKYVRSNGISQTVGVVQASYTIKGKYGDYIKFLDHLFSLDRATTIESVTIPMTVTIDADEDKDSNTYYVGEDGVAVSPEEAKGQETKVTDDTEIEQNITILFLCVEPMDSLKTVDADGTNVVVDQRPAIY